MAVRDREVWAVAQLYVDRFGANARLKADDHTRELRAEGSPADLAAWLRIIEAIDDIQLQRNSHLS
jgi:hypothetical protein